MFGFLLITFFLITRELAKVKLRTFKKITLKVTTMTCNATSIITKCLNSASLNSSKVRNRMESWCWQQLGTWPLVPGPGQGQVKEPNFLDSPYSLEVRAAVIQIWFERANYAHTGEPRHLWTVETAMVISLVCSAWKPWISLSRDRYILSLLLSTAGDQTDSTKL